MTDSLPSVLKAEIERFEALFLPDGPEADHPDVVEGLQTGKSLSCTFGVELSDPEVDGPTVEVHADVEPGGLIAAAWIVARDGEVSAEEYLRPDTCLHRALGVWFTDMWDTWDEVPEGTAGEAHLVRASDLRPGDRLFRPDLTVSSVEDGGSNSAGEGMVVIRYEETPGTDRVPYLKGFTVIRDEPDGE